MAERKGERKRKREGEETNKISGGKEGKEGEGSSIEHTNDPI